MSGVCLRHNAKYGSFKKFRNTHTRTHKEREAHKKLLYSDREVYQQNIITMQSPRKNIKKYKIATAWRKGTTTAIEITVAAVAHKLS